MQKLNSDLNGAKGDTCPKDSPNSVGILGVESLVSKMGVSVKSSGSRNASGRVKG